MIVASVIELGHRLGLSVVAEGVETEHVLDVLRSLGCDVAQGLLFCKPLPAADAPVSRSDPDAGHRSRRYFLARQRPRSPRSETVPTHTARGARETVQNDHLLDE